MSDFIFGFFEGFPLFDKYLNFQTDQLLRKTPIEVEKDATDNPLLKEDPICRVF